MYYRHAAASFSVCMMSVMSGRVPSCVDDEISADVFHRALRFPSASSTRQHRRTHLKSAGVTRHLPRLATMSEVTSNSTLVAPDAPLPEIGRPVPSFYERKRSQIEGMKGVGWRSSTVACSDGGARIPVTLVLLNIARDGIHVERS